MSHAIRRDGVAGADLDAAPRTPAAVPAVAKAVRIVRFLNAVEPRGASLAEIAGSESITRSHCHNILRTLVASGWLRYDASRRVYHLAGGIVADASSVLSYAEPAGNLQPTLVWLARIVKLPCVLSRVDPDGTFIVIDKVDGTHDLAVSVAIGHRFPPDAPVQRKAALAWRDDDEIDAWLAAWRPVRYTANSIVDKPSMRLELEATRRRGYAVSNCEYHDGVMSIGLPIFDQRGEVRMVLQCPGLAGTVQRREEEVAAALRRAVGEIHNILGAKPPPDLAAA